MEFDDPLGLAFRLLQSLGNPFLSADKQGKSTSTELPFALSQEETRRRLLALLELLQLEFSSIDHLNTILCGLGRELNDPASVNYLEEIQRQLGFGMDRSPRASSLGKRLFPTEYGVTRKLREPPRVLLESLDRWEDRVLFGKEWNSTSFRTGKGRLNINDVWVDLVLLHDEHVAPTTPCSAPYGMPQNRVSRGYSQFAQAVSVQTALKTIAPDTMTVVVGEPGGGKTTLAKRITREVLLGKMWDFQLPVYVSLKDWSTSAHFGEEHSLLRWFLSDIGLASNELTEAVSFLVDDLYSRSQTVAHRGLLLLDGWDEVTLQQAALSQILRQISGWTTILLSRPSGMPRSIRSDKVYVLSELSPVASENAVGKFFDVSGDVLRGQQILDASGSSIEIKRFLRNPFLLHLLCRLVESNSVTPESLKSIGRTDLYRLGTESLITDYFREKHEVIPDSELYQLQSLASDLVFRSSGPKYLFTASDVDRNLHGLLSGPCKAARLLDVEGEEATRKTYVFLHASFQEYFAALHLCDIETDTKRVAELVDRFILGLQWEQVFRFASAMARDDHAMEIEKGIAHALKTPDRFNLVCTRMARLIAQMPYDAPYRVRSEPDLQRLLWNDVQEELALGRDRCSELIRLKLRALLELNPYDTVERIYDWWGSQPGNASRKPSRTLFERAIDGTGSFGVPLDRDVAEFVKQEVIQSGLYTQISSSALTALEGEPQLGPAFESLTLNQTKREWAMSGHIPLDQIHKVRKSVSGVDEWMITQLLKLLDDEQYIDAALLDAIECLGGIGAPKCAEGLCDFLLAPESDRRLKAAFLASWKRGLTPSRDIVGDPLVAIRGPTLSPEIEAALSETSRVADEIGNRFVLVENALRQACDPNTRDRLLWELAVRSASDSVVPRILRTLTGLPLLRGVGAIEAVAKYSVQPRIQVCAVRALRTSTADSTDETLAEISGDKNYLPETVAAADDIRFDRVQTDAHLLVAIVESSKRNSAHLRSKALATLAMAVHRSPDSDTGNIGRPFILSLLDGLVSNLKQHENETKPSYYPSSSDEANPLEPTEILLASSKVGMRAVPKLEAILRSKAASVELQIVACRALAEIGGDASRNALLSVFSRRDLDKTFRDEVIRALSRVSPVDLLQSADPGANSALKNVAASRQWLIYKDRIFTGMDSEAEERANPRRSAAGSTAESQDTAVGSQRRRSLARLETKDGTATAAWKSNCYAIMKWIGEELDGEPDVAKNIEMGHFLEVWRESEELTKSPKLGYRIAAVLCTLLGYQFPFDPKLVIDELGRKENGGDLILFERGLPILRRYRELCSLLQAGELDNDSDSYRRKYNEAKTIIKERTLKTRDAAPSHGGGISEQGPSHRKKPK